MWWSPATSPCSRWPRAIAPPGKKRQRRENCASRDRRKRSGVTQTSSACGEPSAAPLGLLLDHQTRGGGVLADARELRLRAAAALLDREARVDLRGEDRRVAEDLLHFADVGA